MALMWSFVNIYWFMHDANDVMRLTIAWHLDMHEKRFDAGPTLLVPTQHRNDSTNYCL